MIKNYLIVVLVFLSAGACAQNLQLHYDFGKDRKYFTSTVEMFKTDKWGSTFLFIDMDYNVGDVKGVSLAYWEIARGINLGKESPFAFHVEYNGGFGQYTDEDLGTTLAYPINDCWLTGLDYNYNNSDYTGGFTVQVLYKYIRGKNDVSFQLTGVWYLNLLKNKVSLSGFADFWREDNRFFSGDKIVKTTFVFQSEPQFWYNFTDHFSFGSEIELGYNFAPVKGFRVNPTLGAKWTF